MDLGLKGKRALVTGSTAGIGFAIAKQLAKQGAHVWINGRTQQRVDNAVRQIGTNAEAIAADLGTEQGYETLFAAVKDLDIVVNNLGIFDAKPFMEIPDDEWRRFFEVNVLSGVRITRQYLPRMLERRWGRVMFISSES